MKSFIKTYISFIFFLVTTFAVFAQSVDDDRLQDQEYTNSTNQEEIIAGEITLKEEKSPISGGDEHSLDEDDLTKQVTEKLNIDLKQSDDIQEHKNEELGIDVKAEAKVKAEAEAKAKAEAKAEAIVKADSLKKDIEICQDSFKKSLRSTSCTQDDSQIEACKNSEDAFRSGNKRLFSMICETNEFDLRNLGETEFNEYISAISPEYDCEKAHALHSKFSNQSINFDTVLKTNDKRLSDFLTQNCGDRAISGIGLVEEQLLAYIVTGSQTIYPNPIEDENTATTLKSGEFFKVGRIINTSWFQISSLSTENSKEIYFTNNIEGMTLVSSYIKEEKDSQQKKIILTRGLQQALNFLGCEAGSVDGALGPKTREAYKRASLQNFDKMSADVDLTKLEDFINANTNCSSDPAEDYAQGLEPVCYQYFIRKDEYRDAQALLRTSTGGCGYAEGYPSVNQAIKAAKEACAYSNHVYESDCELVFAR